jgi:hypothetical protein
MMRPWLLGLLLFATPLVHAQFWGLPGWAEQVVKEASAQKPPEAADAWILLDQTMVTYRGAGEVRKTHTRVAKILTKAGLGEGIFLSRGIGKAVSKIKKLRGWNLRPDGSIRRIDRDDLVSIDADAFENRTISTAVLSGATLPDLEVGSIVAFESQETLKLPMGPVDIVFPVEHHPIWRYLLQLEVDLSFSSSSREKLLSVHVDTRNLKNWAAAVRQSDRLVELEEVCAWPKDEPWAATGLESEPFICLRFDDPLQGSGPSLSTWDTFAKWIYQRYAPMIETIQPVSLEGLGPRDALIRLSQWMRSALTYRMVYLSPERGWVPEHSAETIRRRYGDCKDLATCLLGGARALKLEGSPVLSRLARGRIPADAPVNPYYFNHAIAAIRLDQPLGFPAEVQTPRGRFLLVDATARTTPLGWLPVGHRGARLLICTPEGGIWVDVADSALEREKVDCRIEGQVSPDGILKGTVRIRESADALGLQSTALTEGAKGLQKASLRFAPQAMPARWEVKSVQLPIRPEDPFEATLVIECAGVRLQKGQEWELNLPFLVKAPAPIKRTRVKRHFPIDLPPGVDFHWSAAIEVGNEVRLVRTHGRLGSPFREATWKASSRGEALELALDHQRKPAHWSVEDQDAGLEALRKDRNDYLLFLEEILAFRLGPGSASGHK